MRFTPEKAEGSAEALLLSQKQGYTAPRLFLLSTRLPIKGGSSSYQIENTEGVFYTHS